MSAESPYHFAHSLQVKNKIDFIHILNDFIYVYSPRAGTDNPFDVNRKPLSLCPFIVEISLKSEFIHNLSCI